MLSLDHWLVWALLSATFAALTAVLAKLGVAGVNSDFALAIRTAVVMLALGALLTITGKWQPIASIQGKTWLFLVLSGLATGASWVCYFRALSLGEASRVAAVDKLSVALVAIFAAAILHERLGLTGWLGVGLLSAGVVLIGMSK
jgi:transporter family protein